MYRLRDLATKIPLFIKVVSFHAAACMILFLSVWAPNLIWSSAVKTPITSQIVTTAKIEAPIAVKEIIDGEPLALNVDRLGVHLAIKDGFYDSATSEWTLSDDAVYYAKITVLPNNQRGSTFLYGHNTDPVLAPLSGLVLGDIVTITTKNNHVFTYIYSNDDVVPPDLTTVLYDDPEMPRLTIMTCEGIWSQGRRLMYFDLLEAK